MDTTQFELPALPKRLEWFIDTFQNNEVQAFEPGSKWVITVKKRYNFLGIPILIRPTSYPTYVVTANPDKAFLQDTAHMILEDHERWLAHHPAVA